MFIFLIIFLEAVVRHHTTSGIHCSTANIVDTKVRMLDGTHMKFQCKSSGHYWENSKVVRTDMTAGNGVVHIVNKVQLPNSGIFVYYLV